MADYDIRGWASTPHRDHVGDVVVPGAFAETLRERGIGGPKGVKLLFAHNREKPIGGIKVLEERAGGLWLEGFIETGISYGNDIALAVEANGGLSFSIGYRVLDADFDENAIYLLKLDLAEVSVVVEPCNAEAVMKHSGDVVKELSANIQKMKELFA